MKSSPSHALSPSRQLLWTASAPGKPAVLLILFSVLLFASLGYVVVTRAYWTCLRADHVPSQLPYASDFSNFAFDCSKPIGLTSVRETLYSDIFYGVSPFQDFPPPGVAELLRERWVRGWGSEAAVFEQLIAETRPSLIIELGTFLGASAIHMANISRQLSLDPPLILCVDDFRGWIDPAHKTMTAVKRINGQSLLLYQFMQNVVASGFNESIVPIPVSVEHAGAYFCQAGIQADLVEVDAGHTFHSAWNDINVAYSMLSPKGIIFGHDWPKKGVRRAAELFASLHNLRVVRNDQHWILRPKETSTAQSSS